MEISNLILVQAMGRKKQKTLWTTHGYCGSESEYYESPLIEQELELEILEEKVNQHLKVMGF